MKKSNHARLALCTLALAAVLASAGSACAQASLTFSGGNNTPFVLTLNAPVTYATTASAGNGTGPFFLFKGVGNVFARTITSVVGSITFSIDGGAPQSITIENSGAVGNSLAAEDVFIYGSLPGVAPGSVITLTAGTLTTTFDVPGAPPSNGSFTTFIVDGNGTRNSTDGVSVVPEPATWGLLLGGFGLLASVLRFRRPAIAVRGQT
jgi:hypothetical protein